MNVTCKECKHYHPLGQGASSGQCRAHTPKLMLVPETEITTGRQVMAMPSDCWPMVSAGSWCAEGRKATDEEVVDKEYKNLSAALLNATGVLGAMEQIPNKFDHSVTPVDEDPAKHDKIPEPEVKPVEPRKAATSVLPNDPCPCGSGRKHKRCTCEQYH